jgi:hypothetical protein
MLSLAYKSFMLCTIVPSVVVSWLRLWPLVMKPFRISSCLTFKKYVSTSVGPPPSKLPQLGPISRKMSLPIQGKGLLFFVASMTVRGGLVDGPLVDNPTGRLPTRRQSYKFSQLVDRVNWLTG